MAYIQLSVYQFGSYSFFASVQRKAQVERKNW